jgi:hypothetical protein
MAIPPPISVDGSVRADGSTSSPDMNCASVNQGAAPLPPDILILLDRSGRWSGTPPPCAGRNCGANSRWNQVTAALNAVVPMTDTMVNWGLKFLRQQQQLHGDARRRTCRSRRGTARRS